MRHSFFAIPFGRVQRRLSGLFCAVLFLAAALPLPVQAALHTEFPTTEYATISLPAEEVDALAALLARAEKSSRSTFPIMDTLSGTEETVSTDYSVTSLNASKGIVTVTSNDAALLTTFLEEGGKANATDAEKIAYAMEWIHNNLNYNAYHTGSYVKSCFVEAGGQCNVYNGALCALITWLGYEARLIRGYRGNTASQTAHWWVELMVDDVPYVLECGNQEDGTWHYLGISY